MRQGTWTDRVVEAMGTRAALLCAAALIIVWAMTGPLLHFDSAWQLAINTTTTIVTFLMVFVIQNASNRSDRALHTKLDALIDSIEDATNDVIGLEEQPMARIREAQQMVRPDDLGDPAP